MAKKRTFENLLDVPFRWPAPGDMPFVEASDPFQNANIAEDGYTRLHLMIEGYKAAADLMVGAAEHDDSQRNTLVFPIVFNYRQFIELSLKYQIAMYGPYVGVDPNWQSHDLASLWTTFLDIVDRYGSEDPDTVDPIVGQIVLEFAKIDPGSYSYRYPLDRRGRPIDVPYADVHLPTLADVMQAVDGYFTGCDGFLDHLKSSGP